MRRRFPLRRQHTRRCDGPLGTTPVRHWLAVHGVPATRHAHLAGRVRTCRRGVRRGEADPELVSGEAAGAGRRKVRRPAGAGSFPEAQAVGDGARSKTVSGSSIAGPSPEGRHPRPTTPEAGLGEELLACSQMEQTAGLRREFPGDRSNCDFQRPARELDRLSVVSTSSTTRWGGTATGSTTRVAVSTGSTTPGGGPTGSAPPRLGSTKTPR